MSAKQQKRARSEYPAEGSSSGKRKKSEESEEGNELEEGEDCKVFFFIFRGVEVWKV